MVDEADGASIKGSVLIARVKYVRDTAGEAGLRKVLARLPEQDRQVLGGLLLPVCWYPLALNDRLDGAVAAELSPGDQREAFLRMGRASADINLRGPHRSFVREGDPHYLLKHAPQIYGFYYKIGRRTYERTGERAAVLKTFDAENVTASDCLTVLGWHARAVELCGGRDVEVSEPLCRARGDAHCEIHLSWE